VGRWRGGRGVIPSLLQPLAGRLRGILSDFVGLVSVARPRFGASRRATTALGRLIATWRRDGPCLYDADHPERGGGG